MTIEVKNNTRKTYPLVMGILNITPDSFYDGGRYNTVDDALQHAENLVSMGADIIDVGGESSRPGALPVSEQEEMDRICPVLERIASEFHAIISVDTYKSNVADAALKMGASIINDISAFSLDERMPEVIASHDARVVLMHMKGTPDIMQHDTRYNDIVDEIYTYLEERSTTARNAGIDPAKIIIDPGIGFGKSLQDNYVLIDSIPKFKEMGYPVLIGLSRKSLIGKLYNEDEDRLPATLALNSIALYNGANIIRVHDVHEHYLAIRAIKQFRRDNNIDDSNC